MKLDLLKNSLNSHYDVFLASASYETRCLSIYFSINKSSTFSKKIVSLSVSHKQLMEENLQKFRDEDFSIVEVHSEDQLETISNLTDSVQSVLTEVPSASFLVDITAFTRQTLLILLRVFRNSLSDINNIKFLYAPANEYSINLPYKDKWLTKGVIRVNSVIGYSGIIRPSRPYHLIILIGFETERAAALIESYEPEKITIGYAKKIDSISDKNYDLNVDKYKLLLSEYPHADFFEFSCLNAIECTIDILNQAKKHLDHNIIISPMNNKISTLACAAAAFKNSEIQLAIAVPAIYNHENYSTPGDICEIIDLPDFIRST